MPCYVLAAVRRTHNAPCQVDEFESDLATKLAAQEKKSDHEPPAFSSAELMLAHDRLDKVFTKVNSKKKPKPPPEPKPAANETGKAPTAIPHLCCMPNATYMHFHPKPDAAAIHAKADRVHVCCCLVRHRQ
jgi:hypothetical protein